MMSRRVPTHNHWAAIVGRGKHGKRETVEDVAEKLRDRGHHVGGVRVERVDGPAPGYDLVDLCTSDRARAAVHASDPDVCDLRFDPAAFEQAAAWCLAPGLDVVLIELGKLEATGGGLWPTFEALLAGPPRIIVACIRPNVLADICLRLPDPLAWLDMTEPPLDPDRFIEAIEGAGRPTAVFGVRGFSDSGKTRLVEQLIPCLIDLGLDVATVKHASHELTLDVRGKDSHRHAAAGASRVLLLGPRSASLFVHQDAPVELEPWLPLIAADLDIVVVEGFKRTPMPHVEIQVCDGGAFGLDRTTKDGQLRWLLTRPPVDGDLDFPDDMVRQLAAAVVTHLFPRRVG